MRRALPYLLAAGLVVFGWKKYHERVAQLADEGAGDASATLPVGRQGVVTADRRCDGRVYCSQMTSCEEATWFLQHCPGVKMDGNNDGIPCEKQWCK